MSLWKLIFRNLFRNRLRTALTALLLATNFFFVAMLMGILHSFTAVSDAGLNRLVVQNATAITNKLPLSYEEKLRKIPGVVAICKQQWIGNYYQDKRNYFPNFAVDAASFENVFDDYRVDPAQLAAWKADRRGALVGRELMQRFGWRLGQRITLQRNIYPFDAELTIRGIVDHPVQQSSLFFHFDYFIESMPRVSAVGTYWLKVGRRAFTAPVSEQIDAMFHNSDFPTETYSEKEYQAGQVAWLGNVTLLFTALSGCAVAMVVILAAITMSMSARERTGEIAVLKAIGFPAPLVLATLLAEFALLTTIGGGLGIAAAKETFNVIDMTKLSAGAVKGFAITPALFAACALAAAATGLLAGGLPALRATRLTVVDGLRRIV